MKKCLITPDCNGECGWCKSYESLHKAYPENPLRLADKLYPLSEKNKNKKYDAIIGISGGCDSSFLMHFCAKVYGLRLLAVTFDNTWSSRIAVENIYNMTRKLNIDLHTYVVDNQEFNDICRSFLYASVPDADIPNDIAITSLYYKVMNEFELDTFICGHSFRTEGFAPLGWTYMDGMYVKSVHEQFGKIPIKTFPNLELGYWLNNINKIRIRPIYYINYNKEIVKHFLQSEYEWQWYGGHHCENEYTKFVKNYLLPVKFGIDKRRVEFSALIKSGQMKYDDAVEQLKTPPEYSNDELGYVKKRLNLSGDEFDNIMKLPVKSHNDYETYKSYFKENRVYFEKLKNEGKIPETFYLKYCF